MIGKTNSKQAAVNAAQEFVNVQLSTNQSSHGDLAGAKVTVSYGTYTKEYTWSGSEITFTIPAYINYTVSFGSVEGYKTPASVSHSAIEDNARTIEAVYQCELVKVSVSADDGSSVNGAVVTINGKSHTWNGKVVEQKVPFGTSYSVSVGDFSGYIKPSSKSYTANSVSREVSMVYAASSLVVNILSNQGTDATISGVQATVKYGSTSVNVVSGQRLNIPSGSAVTITFPEVDGYLKPENITFTHNGGFSEKSGTYLCELLTVNVSADQGSVSGFEVIISKQETVGVATKYTRLEYIESNGLQYIDTGFKPNQDTRVVADMHLLQNNSSVSANELFGARTSTSSKAFAVQYNNTTGKLQYFYGGGYTELSANLPNAKAVCDANKNNLSYNGTEISRSYSTFQCDYSLYLFALNNAGRVSFQSIARMYSCQIYDNETMVHDYIPALRSDGIAGLYDAVNDTFYASNGSSNFSYGSIEPTIVATQTSVTGTYKIPFDASYTVQASKVGSYTTPASVTRIANTKSYTVAQQYTLITEVDLSLQDVYGNPINRSTANCYVIREAGTYKFPLVFGNSIKNGKVNTAAFTNNGGVNSHDFYHGWREIISSPYIIETKGSLFVDNADVDDCISGLEKVEENGIYYAKFNINNVPSSGGNIIIGFGTDVCIWSWHIWLWPHDLTPVEITNSTGVKYKIMPVNLASKYDSDGVHIKNWFYQWGRPNPMLLPSAWNSTTDHTPGTIYKETKAQDLAYGIGFPREFFYNSSSPYNWFGDKSYYNLWDAACTGTGNSDNDTVKTVYDPCPVGWKVPNGNAFTGLSILSHSNGIVKMRRYSGDTVGVGFAQSGYRQYSDGNISRAGTSGFVWLSSSFVQNYAYNLEYLADTSYLGKQDYDVRANGLSIRPVQDDNIWLDVIMISFKIGTSSYQAESGMTWFEWVNSEYNTAGATISGDYIYIGSKTVTGSGVAIYNNIIGGGQYTLEK